MLPSLPNIDPSYKEPYNLNAKYICCHLNFQLFLLTPELEKNARLSPMNATKSVAFRRVYSPHDMRPILQSQTMRIWHVVWVVIFFTKKPFEQFCKTPSELFIFQKHHLLPNQQKIRFRHFFLSATVIYLRHLIRKPNIFVATWTFNCSH